MPPRDTRTGDACQATLIPKPGKTPCFTCGNPEGVLRWDLPLKRAFPDAATLCGPCWARFGGKASAIEIGAEPLLALPVRAASSPTEWHQVLAAAPWLERIRSDARDRLLALIEGLRNWANWSSQECWPTWARLCQLSGWARSTLANWLRQLWIMGWIDRIEPGSTARTRPMSLAEVEGNRAAVYGLRIPEMAERRDEAPRDREARDLVAELTANEAQLTAAEGKSWTPSWSFDLDLLRIEVTHLRTRARNLVHSSGSCPEVEKMEPLRGRFDQKNRAIRRFWETAPGTRAEMLVAAAELRREHPVPGRMSVRAVRAACRVYWRAGWSNRDVLWALRYQPTGWAALSEMTEYAVIHPSGWVRARLSAWRRPDGKVLPGRGAMVDARIDQRANEQQHRERYGDAGAKLLHTPGLLWAAVAAHGRRCAEQLARETRAEQARHEATAQVRDHLDQQKTRRRALTAQLLAQARAAKPTQDPNCASNAATSWNPPEEAGAVTPEARHARALARARGEGRMPFVRRRKRLR